MQIITTNYLVNDDFRTLFLKYKDEVGDLFQDGNQILSDGDYRTLYRRLSNIAEWSIDSKHNPCPSANDFVDRVNRNNILAVPHGDIRYFFRCFGIYLREATMRYGADFSNEGGFWQSMELGIQRDLADAYAARNDGGQRQRNCFWSGVGIRNELTVGSPIQNFDGTLLEYIFSFFDNTEISDVQEESARFVRHLVKVAVCPLNYNPIRKGYDDLRNSSQSIEAQINMAERNTLNYHPDTKRLLTDRILRYFQVLPRIKHEYDGENVDGYISNVLRSTFRIENRQHYFADWLRRELTNTFNRPVRTIHIQNRGGLTGNYQIKVSYNAQNRMILVSAPSDLNFDVLFGADLQLDPWGIYDILGENDESLLHIEDGQVQKPNGREDYNEKTFKVLQLETIRLRDEDNDIISVKNPWALKNYPCFIFDRHGLRIEKSMSAGPNETYTIILPAGDQINSIKYWENGIEHDDPNQLPQMQNANGLSVCNWTNNLTQADAIVIDVVSADNLHHILHYENQDAVHLHLYEDADLLAKTRFMWQQHGKKIGIGSVYLTHLPDNVALNQLVSQINQNVGVAIASADIGQNHAPRIKLVNTGNTILYIPETEIDGGRITPEIVLLPEGVSFWMAREDDTHFNAYLKTARRIENISNYWQHDVDTENYKYCVDNNENWRNRGFPVEFAEGLPTIFAKKPYFTSLLNFEERMYFASDFFWGNNLFDNMIPQGAFLYFKWKEADHLFKAKIPSTTHSVNRCLECFGLEGCYPDMEFGWLYEGTKFTVNLYSDQNARNLPRRLPYVYEMSDENRSEWLLARVERDTPALVTLLNRYNQAFFGEDFHIQNMGELDDLQGPDDVLLEIGSRYLNSIGDVRRDLIDLTRDQKIAWLRSWLEVNDWDEMQQHLLKQLALRRDDWHPAPNDISAAKKFNSAEDIDRFVARRFIEHARAQLLNTLIHDFQVDIYRYILPFHLLDATAQDEAAFRNSFGEMVRSFKRSYYIEAWNEVCQNACPALLGYDSYVDDLNNRAITAIEQVAKKYALWCVTLYKADCCDSWNELRLYIPDFLPNTLEQFNDDDIRILATRYAEAVQNCKAFAQGLNYEISMEVLVSTLAFTREMLTHFAAENNHQLDFNESRQRLVRTIALNSQVENRLTSAGKENELARIQTYLDDYIANCDVSRQSVDHFLQFVIQRDDLVFLAERRTWSNVMLGLGNRDQRKNIPTECLLMQPAAYREYAIAHGHGR